MRIVGSYILQQQKGDQKVRALRGDFRTANIKTRYVFDRKKNAGLRTCCLLTLLRLFACALNRRR